MNEAENPSREILHNCLHTLALFGFAVAQPLYDLLSQYPQFLVAHKATPFDILLLSVALSFLIPMVVVGGQLLVRLIGPRVYQAVHLLVLGILGAGLSLQVTKKLAGFSPSGALFLAVGLGLLLVLIYHFASPLRLFFSFLSLAILVFPLQFLLNTSIRPLVFPDAGVNSDYGVDSDTPIIFVVFDELPLISLLDQDNSISRDRYPNFAALAKDAYWFRNSTSVSDSTVLSIPAILDGLYPRPGKAELPNLAGHPHNLFTLFSRSHDLLIHENITQLSPSGDELGRTSRTESFYNLFRDLELVYLHILFPAPWTEGLPRVTEAWRDFGTEVTIAPPSPDDSPRTWTDFKVDWSDRSAKFREFIQSIRPSSEPGLYFLHSMLPHASWIYLPDGRRYTLTEAPGVLGVVGPNDQGIDVNRWHPDNWLALQAYQRHLLQVGFVDTLIGELVAHLKEQRLYDECLLVITADHGTSFKAGDSRRALSQQNYPAILSVPLIIKAPWQTQGETTDRNVELVDVLPTIADILGFQVPWKTDGRSALDTSQPEKEKKYAFFKEQILTFDARWPYRDQLLTVKLSNFGSGDFSKAYNVGHSPGLLGRSVNEFTIVESNSGDAQVQIDGRQFFSKTDPQAPFILTQVRGELKNPNPSKKPVYLAVSVNGVLRALTQTSEFLNKHLGFSALVDPTFLRSGDNQIEIFSVLDSTANPRLQKLSVVEATYTIKQTASGKTVEGPNGKLVPLVKDHIIGWVVGGLEEDGNRGWVGGWVVDKKARTLVESVIVLQDGVLAASGRTTLDRTDGVKMFDNEKLLRSGFRLNFPLGGVAPEKLQIRVLAISKDGVAGELYYPRRSGTSWPFQRNR